MSRPCFALSVMLCCMAGPLLVIGKTHAQDITASPSHDPGECIVCPLAYGPFDACGGYSDYDYNRYWFEDNSPPAPEVAPPADPELEVAQSLTDASTDAAWESDYEDYYADYAFGDDSTTTYEEDVYEDDVTLEATPAPIASIDAATEAISVPELPEVEEAGEIYDGYGWYTYDSAADEDYFDSYDGYEPIAPATPDVAAGDEATAEEAAIDYEAYEEEWFSYGSETTVEAQEVTDSANDEAYEALSESASEAYSDDYLETESVDAEPAYETWGDEEAWYREEYGYEDVSDEAIAEPVADVVPVEPLETGYDEVYDEAMATDWEAAESVAEIVPATPHAQSPEADDPAAEYYESYYDAYDDLYNFESTPAESCPAESREAVLETEPAWLTELINRVLAPVWIAAGRITSNEPLLYRDARPAIYVDECAQEWDCEADYWARPQADEPSVVLQAADTLEGMASLLQNAAEHLRSVAGGHLAETAQTGKGGPAR